MKNERRNALEIEGLESYADRRNRIAVEVYRLIRQCDEKGIGRTEAIAQVRHRFAIYSTNTIYKYLRLGASLSGVALVDRRAAKAAAEAVKGGKADE